MTEKPVPIFTITRDGKSIVIYSDGTFAGITEMLGNEFPVHIDNRIRGLRATEMAKRALQT